MPGSLEVNGRKGRRVICIISQDRLRYVLFDLDSSHEEDTDGDDEADAGSLDREAGDEPDMEL